MVIRGVEIKVVKADITELKVDAIVNAANNKLLMGGGVAGAIKRKGGRVIEDEAVKKGPIKIGEAVATSGGNLPAKFVIHAATMDMDFQTDENKIRSSAKSALQVCRELKIQSVAFPALGCGIGGFPLLAAAKIMAQEVFRVVRRGQTALKEIVFCLYDQEASDVFNIGVIKYLKHVTEELQNGPFTTVDAIIEVDGGVVVIKRSNPPFGWALPGGFLDFEESLEAAVVREAKEETGLDIYDVRQFQTYSDPSRDPRFHTVATVFTAKAKGRPRAGDDAAALKVITEKETEGMDFAFDHKQILQDYFKYKTAA